MIYTANFLEIAGRLNHVEIVKYLRDLGWKEVENYPNVKIFQAIKEEELYQADIPITRHIRDYESAMFRVVEQIAEFSNKSAEHVLLELLNPLSDILRFQVISESAESGTIKVEDAIKLYENAKKLITAAAMDYYKPSQYHLGRPDAISNELVKNCKFGQTEIGSYIVSLVLPFTKELDDGKLVQMNLFGEEADKANSPTRNVTNQIITSIKTIKETIDNGTFTEMMIGQNEEQPSPPISANFLEALSSIGIYQEGAEVNISVKWAPTVQSNKASVDSVSLTSEHYKPIEAVVQTIKSKRANETEFFGKISRLKATPNADKRTDGEITLVYLEKERACTAKVLLQKEDFHVATEAFDQGKPVKVTGRLSGQKSKAIEYSKFEVVESWG